MHARDAARDPAGPAARRPGRTAASEAPAVRAEAERPSALGDLQRGPGNAAVVRMLQRSRDDRVVAHAARHPTERDGAERDHAEQDPVVQRQIVRFDTGKGTPGAPATELFEGFIEAVDAAVAWAHRYVTTSPQLGPLHDYDGYTKRWVDVWREFVADGRTGGISKEFGYAIESVAKARLEGTGRPALPSGAGFRTQVAFGATRPDYVLYAGGEVVGAVDITAAGSAGHVLEKANWERYFPQFGECLYGSLTPLVVGAMRLAHDNEAPLSQEQADQLRQQAAANRAAEQENWERMRESFTRSMTSQGLLDGNGRVKGGGDPLVRDDRRRTAVVGWMTENLGVDEAGAQANASGMLLTFHPSWPASFAFHSSTASASRGEAFLTSVLPEWTRRQER